MRGITRISLINSIYYLLGITRGKKKRLSVAADNLANSENEDVTQKAIPKGSRFKNPVNLFVLILLK